ncbi:MAG: 3-oxoacyl-ACP reductase [Cytophagales bacterium CG18_big_fil_WC_8_21_14_2_50_42_9]|nr:MAG: 3-oxoacyl-ACP reductase [Cytophagales bacterium CG18_big_fil_WC_8_21_14_2_50_42_9]
MKTDLQHKVALITGAGKGIGKSIALYLAEAGADIIVNYRSDEKAAQQVCKEIQDMGRKALAIQADVAIYPEAERLVQEATSAFNKIDILVNNAGVAPPKGLNFISEAEWNQVIGVNLSSAFFLTQLIVPGMRSRQWGRIINISSVAAHTGGVIGPHYAASKGGMNGLTHAYASLLATEGITVNAIAPALIETDMIRDNPKITPDLLPVKRFGLPEEIAQVALMLAGNGYITGQTINVDGGMYMS